MQSPTLASSRAWPPSAASPKLGRWICQQGLRSARVRCLLQVLLLLLLLLRCCCAAAAASTTALAVLPLIAFRTDMMLLKLRSYDIFLLLFPAPTSSLAVLFQAASPQLRWWVCHLGLRSARIRGLLLVLAAASAAAATAAASTTTALAFYVWSQFVLVV